MVEELCDRIFLINEGKRVLYGELNSIKDKSGERRVRLLAEGDLSSLSNFTYIRDLQMEGKQLSFTIPSQVGLQELIGDLPVDIKITQSLWIKITQGQETGSQPDCNL